jgi:hypothetical protein
MIDQRPGFARRTDDPRRSQGFALELVQFHDALGTRTVTLLLQDSQILLAELDDLALQALVLAPLGDHALHEPAGPVGRPQERQLDSGENPSYRGVPKGKEQPRENQARRQYGDLSSIAASLSGHVLPG